MKRTHRLNPIQVAASAAGAVLSAVIASFFGVDGTIIGTAIGSIVATTASAIVWESIERGHDAVRQVVVKQGPLLHQGGTESAGEVTSADARASAVEAQVDAGLDAQAAVGRPADGAVTARPPGETAAAGEAEVRQQAPIDPTRQERAGTADLLAAEGAGSTSATAATGAVTAGAAVGGAAAGAGSSLSGAGDADDTGPRRLLASSRSQRSAQVRRTAALPERRPRRAGPFQRRWVVAGSIVGVFVVALGVVTAVEAVAGRPLSALFGASQAGSGTSAVNMFTGTPPPKPPTKTTTTTTSPSTSSSTSTTTTSPTTSTTTTTTTTPSASTTTTTTTTPSTSGGTGQTGSSTAPSGAAGA